ncbi:MAG: ABC transporter permease [Candidatus Thorarchaeota archaeon]
MKVLTTEKNLEDPFQEAPQKSFQRLTHKTKNLWRVIAKNEIKLRTSRFRNYRKLFFISLYVLLSIWAFLLAPFLFDLFIPTLAVQFSSVFKPVVTILIESSMMILFLVLMMYPLNNVYRETEIGFKETLVSTPVKANDIFLGEFLGKSPIYTIAVLVFAPIIVGLINPITNLTFIQYIVIYSSIFGLVYFANLIGTIFASWIEHKITQSEKARDLGKALIWIFTILLVVIMYAVMFFLNFLLAHPELKNWLSFYPSFWFSNIILYSIDPILLNTSVLNVWLSLLLVIGVPILILYISFKKSELFYTLETGIEKSSVTIIEHENLFYRTVRKGAGSKWGGLILIQLKRFLRKKANFARIAYVVGLVGFISWFISRMGEDAFGLVLATTMIIALGGGVTSMMIGHLAFLDSKDIIWVYKRSPRGIKGLVYSYLLAMLVLNIFITIIITILFSVFANLDFIGSVIFFFEFLLFGQISMVQAMGIQCISPAYGEKDSNMRGNAMISMLLLQPIMFIPIMLIIFLDLGSLELMISMMHGIIFLYNVGVSLPLLYFGLKKLNKIE